MEKDKSKSKGRIAIFITAGIIVISGAVLLFMLLGNKEEEGSSVHEIPLQRVGAEEGASLNMPYEYIQSIMNRQESLLQNAVDIEAQTIITKRSDDIKLGYKLTERWYEGSGDKLLYVQGITSIRTIERKGNCKVTFIDGYDSSCLMKKNEGNVGGYAILPEWMKKSIASGYTVDDITILLMNEEPRPDLREFKVIGFYTADSEDTVYASMYSYAELYTAFEEEALDSLITSLSIYYEDGADMSSIYSFMNDYFSDSETKKEGENWVYMDYDFFYVPVTEQ
ncbi:MAG: hypothetical protein BWX97_01957 [Firmicutes bacterium ADurb.Bin146]|jgi:hypothetical protein|nr:MAG: hypothetical protein BWX97_01957 [Firmicutes bacterium ADurb.Bin146]